MNYAAVDFESYFDDECSIKTLGTDGYILHPKFHVYQVAIAATSGFEWVGALEDAPWGEISGPEWEWLAHNASYDERVHHYLLKWGLVVNSAQPRLWHCTADLCAFNAGPRALAQASSFFYGEKVAKDYRDIMKGKLFAAVDAEKQAKVREAGLTDARKAVKFWVDMSPKWPEKERRVSQLSRQQGWFGLRLDREGLEQDVQLLRTLKWTAEQMIPWQGAEANLSYPALVAECQKVGIAPPLSTSMTSEDCAAWEERHGDQFPWIDAMRTARRANALLTKAETMLLRIREEDGRMPYANKYFGAHTGRWGDGGEDSGRNKQGGFNSRNLPRKEMFGEEYFLGKPKDDGTREIAKGKNFAHIWQPGMRGVNLRHRIVPAPGCHFTPADLSQIEPRVSWVYAGDHKSLELVRQGLSPYEAHAIASMGWTGAPLKSLSDTDPVAAGLYQLAKARVLALGYNAGWLKFIAMAPLYVSPAECKRIFSAPVSEENVTRFMEYLQRCRIREWLALWGKADQELRTTYVNSWKIVMDFRRQNPLLADRKRGMWAKMQKFVESAIGEDLEVALPSGRCLIYRKIARTDGDVTGIVMKYGKPMRMKLYGGLLFENLVQATARDVFVECLLRLDDAGYQVPMHVHDEAVPEIPLSVSTEVIQEIMSQPPEWMKSLPVASDCKSRLHYTK